ncbi:MAG: hypothetical protein HOY79_29470 [Streptomyces sp.]|nr:hypothetical protein [Streptomyces sp.]
MNFSYHPGPVTTTVYWNNHCNYTERAGAVITDHDGVMTTECFSVPRGTGHIKFQQGYSGYFENIDEC